MNKAEPSLADEMFFDRQLSCHKRLSAYRKGVAPQGHHCNITFLLWPSQAGSSRFIYCGSLSLCCSPSGKEPLCSSCQHRTGRDIKARLLQKHEQVLTECALKTALSRVYSRDGFPEIQGCE